MQPMTEECFRDAFVELAEATHELGARESSRADYLELMGPNEPEQVRRDFTVTVNKDGMRGASGCALLGRALLLRAGIEHPRLRANYVSGKAVEDLYEIARQAGGLVDVRMHGLRGRLPKRGDMPWMSSPEHVCIVRTLEDHDAARSLEEETYDAGAAVVPLRGITIESTDGGQRDAGGWQIIRPRSRRWYRDTRGAEQLRHRSPPPLASGDTIDPKAPPGAGGRVRTLLGWFDTWEIYKRFGPPSRA